MACDSPTATLGGKTHAYTVKSNGKDYTDIANKGAEMQTAIRYLATKGIINGTGAAGQTKDARGRFILHDGTIFRGYLFDEGQL